MCVISSLYMGSMQSIAWFACVRIVSVYIRYLHASDPDRSKATKEGGGREGIDRGNVEEGKPGLVLTFVLSGRDRKACRAWMYTSGHALLRCTRVHRARASGGEEWRIDIVEQTTAAYSCIPFHRFFEPQSDLMRLRLPSNTATRTDSKQYQWLVCVCVCVCERERERERERETSGW